MADDEDWARRRSSFGDYAETYDAARPDWPADTAAWLAGDRRELTVVDLAAGTGKLTRALVDLGHRVIAVEPSDGMIAVLRRQVPEAEVRQGSAEAIPLDDASVDAVTVGQAWHWFDAAAAGAECARVLRPGGVIGIAWHVLDGSAPWAAEVREILSPAATSRDDGPPVVGEGFGPVEEAVFRYRQRVTVDGLVDQVSSWSHVALSPRRAEILDGVRALAAREAAADGTLLLDHDTHSFRAVRTGD